MFTLYAILLVGVCAVMLGLLVEAVINVSRKPRWGERRQAFALVEVEERRHLQLPFVGVDRREVKPAANVEIGEERKRA